MGNGNGINEILRTVLPHVCLVVYSCGDVTMAFVEDVENGIGYICNANILSISHSAC